MRKKVMNPSFPGHAPGKDTLRAANAATKVGANGGENARASVLRSEVVVFPSFFVVLRQNKDSRRDGGHAPPQRHLESRERGDEREVHGEKTG